MAKTILKEFIPAKIRNELSNIRHSLRDVKYREIRKIQKQKLKQFLISERKVIIFLVPGKDIISGGLLSISSLYEETKKLYETHKSIVFLCNLPGDSALLRFTKFANNNDILNFSQVLRYFKLDFLQFHVPEYAVSQVLKCMSRRDRAIIRKIPVVKINILLQNINLLPNSESIKELGKLGKLSCTTAHTNYSTLEIRNKIGCPLHKLSTYVSPEKYLSKNYSEKEDLLIVSPDSHPRKNEILDRIRNQKPELIIKEIKNLTYEQYKETISSAKWALTFGEGLDNYFIETIFSGGISFSVFNNLFFTEDFKMLKTVYPDYDGLVQKIVSDINLLDKVDNFAEYHNLQFKLCANHYSYDTYVNNLKLFYLGNYTYK